MLNRTKSNPANKPRDLEHGEMNNQETLAGS